jgi:hypothetical protein
MLPIASRPEGFRCELFIVTVATQSCLYFFGQRVSCSWHQVGIIVEPFSALGHPGKKLLNVTACGENLCQPLGRSGGISQHPQEPVRLTQVLAEVAKGQ